MRDLATVSGFCLALFNVAVVLLGPFAKHFFFFHINFFGYILLFTYNIGILVFLVVGLWRTLSTVNENQRMIDCM